MKLTLPGRPSLVRRLVVLAAGWSFVALIVTGFVLTAQFQRASVSRLEQRLADNIETLLAETEVPGGRIVAPSLNDARLDRAYSGKYWQIAEIGPKGQLLPVVWSRSLFDKHLTASDEMVAALKADPGKVRYYGGRINVGSSTQPLHVGALLVRSMTGHPTPVILMAAENRESDIKDGRVFAATTAAALILLGVGILAGVFIQVRVGLQPLFDLRREVAEVRMGKADALVRVYPAELSPLAEELNALVAHNLEVVERQRTHVGNLAHALKTPLSVMLAEAEAEATPTPLGGVVRRQAQAMHGHVEHHLRRARAAARAQGQRERTMVAPVLEELTRTLERIFRDRNVVVEWDCDESLCFQGERQDLMEIIGNVMENACKWSAGRVRTEARPAGEGRIVVVVEDDGPGLPADRRDEVLKRGSRLDEATPGSGLGLSIVDELARAYDGGITLGDSTLGGLKVELVLPGAEG